MNIQELYTEATSQLAPLNAFVSKHELEGKALADHIGYDCGSSATFDSLRTLLEVHSLYMHQSFIAGRRIAVFKLKEPFETAVGPVAFFELADQKPDGSQKDGIEHVEIYPTDGSFDELVAYLEGRGAEGKPSNVPHHKTHKFPLTHTFTLKIESCALMDKIKDEEL